VNSRFCATGSEPLRNEYQGLYEPEMPSQPALRLHRRHSLRALPLGFETGAENVKIFSAQLGNTASGQDVWKNLKGYGTRQMSRNR
jgi:hypothetical protein